ncbi:MAG: prepilin-type N-terminal cleavage/methylation domain-containing protein [Thermodesulforhabdaceae bacterium]
MKVNKNRISLQDEIAFSLVELLVVIAIVAIVASLSTYAMSVYRNSLTSKLRDDMLNALERARFLSMASVPHGVECTSSEFRIVGLKDGRCSNNNDPCYSDSDCGGNLCQPGDYIKTSDENDESYRITFEHRKIPSGYSLCCTSSCPSSYIIWFDRRGIPRDYSWGLGMTTVTIKYSGSDVASIIISPAGRIQYERR